MSGAAKTQRMRCSYRTWGRRRCSTSWARSVGAAIGVCLLSFQVQAQPLPATALPGAKPSPASRSEDGVRWQRLSADQREALRPLEREWPAIDAQRKQKWLTLAARFKTLGPEEQARITERMSEWTRLTPSERGQARLRFEESRQVPVPDRNARWEAYQALPLDSRQRFAARAASAASTSTAASRRDPASVAAAKAARDAREGREGKVNVVPNAAFGQPSKAVGPTLVQAAPGATTTLITRRPTPPAHQQTGMPKIAATPEFVNRSTLLPKRGPQAAAVMPAAAPAPAAVIVSRPVAVPIVPSVPRVNAPAAPSLPNAPTPAPTPPASR